MNRTDQALGMIAVVFVILMVFAYVLYATQPPVQIEQTGGAFQHKNNINKSSLP